MKRVIKCSALADKIRKGDMEYDPSVDGTYAEDDGIYVQFQDRKSETSQYDMKTRKWLDKQPRVSSKTWARVWKDGELVKHIEGPKYQVRQDIANFVDSISRI